MNFNPNSLPYPLKYNYNAIESPKSLLEQAVSTNQEQPVIHEIHVDSTIEESHQEKSSLQEVTIVECGLNEAVFSHAKDPNPIIATDSLASCIGVCGYDSIKKCGFIFHIISKMDFERSQDDLKDKIMKISQHPFQVHLRGGIKGISNQLLESIENWIDLFSHNGCVMKISSKEVLSERLKDSGATFSSMSIQLDTRDGSIGTYDASTHQNKQTQNKIHDIDSFGDMLTQLEDSYYNEHVVVKTTYFPF